MIETDFERIDAGALASASSMEAMDLLAVLAEVAEFVEFGVVAERINSGCGGGGRGLIGEGF